LLVSASSTSGHGFWIRNVQPLGEDIGGTFWWGNSSQSTWSYTLKGTTYHNHPVKSMKCKVSNAYIIMFLELLPSYFRTPLGKTNQTRRVPFSDRLIYNLHGERWTVTLDPTKNGIWSPEIILDPPVPDQLVAQKNPRHFGRWGFHLVPVFGHPQKKIRSNWKIRNSWNQGIRIEAEFDKSALKRSDVLWNNSKKLIPGSPCSHHTLLSNMADKNSPAILRWNISQLET
jgi:hypothetical protein